MTFGLSEGWTQSSRDGRWVIRGLIDPAEWLGGEDAGTASGDLSPIQRDPDICGGIATFRGTAVPLYGLVEYLAEGGTLDGFCRDYPTVPPVLFTGILGIL